jgi:hypothetical protein
MAKYIVTMAPVQVKEKPHLGNIYDWVLIDFYSKLLRYQGNEVVAPSLWNAVGHPIINLLRAQNLKVDQQNIDTVVEQCIATSKRYMHTLGVELSPTYRDDKFGAELQLHLKQAYPDVIFKKEFVGKYCAGCDRILGSDPEIIVCKRCETPTKDILSIGYFIRVNIGDIRKKVAKVRYLPEGIQTAILNFAETLPSEYDLLITKDREHTVSVMIRGENVQLDPRFVTLMTIPLVNKMHSNDETQLIVIHGDVVKKFDYYNLSYTNENELPLVVFSHGACVGSDGKKIRTDPDAKKDILDALIERYSPKTVRGFLLSRDLGDTIVISEGRFKEVDVLKAKLNRTRARLEANKNRREGLPYPNLKNVDTSFYKLAQKLKLSGVFSLISNLVADVNKTYLKEMESGQFHPEEPLLDFLHMIKHLYFSGMDKP